MIMAFRIWTSVIRGLWMVASPFLAVGFVQTSDGIERNDRRMRLSEIDDELTRFRLGLDVREVREESKGGGALLSDEDNRLEFEYDPFWEMSRHDGN